MTDDVPILSRKGSWTKYFSISKKQKIYDDNEDDNKDKDKSKKDKDKNKKDKYKKNTKDKNKVKKDHKFPIVIAIDEQIKPTCEKAIREISIIKIKNKGYIAVSFINGVYTKYGKVTGIIQYTDCVIVTVDIKDSNPINIKVKYLRFDDDV